MRTADNARRPCRGDGPAFRHRLVGLYAVLAVFNGGAWIWAFIAFHGDSLLLGVGAVVYGLGLRHAVDADHIAAIDNVTRKLIQEQQRPVAVGFFFAVGHSAVVLMATAAIVGATWLFGSIQAFRAIGGTISTIVSSGFLVAVAAMNISIFAGLLTVCRRLRAGESTVSIDLDLLVGRRGLLARFYRPLFGIVSKSWHMLPLGALFGLGFDTATEVAMFGVSAAQLNHGLAVGAVLVFPVLFAAGMALADTTDGVVMLGAYRWALLNPIRKVAYNMAITLVSVGVAVLVAGLEVLRLAGDLLHAEGGVWNAVGALNDHFGELGLLIVGILLAAWGLSWIACRASDRTGPPATDLASPP